MDLDLFMYGINNRNHTIVSNDEQLVSNDSYGGGRNAVNEYILHLTPYIIVFIY